jgi:hypothetical protein
MALLRETTPEYVGSETVEEIEAAAQSREEEAKKPRARESRLTVAFIIVSLVFCLVLSLWPQVHTSVIEQAARSYTVFEVGSP